MELEWHFYYNLNSINISSEVWEYLENTKDTFHRCSYYESLFRKVHNEIDDLHHCYLNFLKYFDKKLSIPRTKDSLKLLLMNLENHKDVKFSKYVFEFFLNNSVLVD